MARVVTLGIAEAAKNTLGHSSAAQAGEIARRAAASRLVLIHYRPTPGEYDRWLEEAAAAFGGPVELARDLRVPLLTVVRSPLIYSHLLPSF